MTSSKLMAVAMTVCMALQTAGFAQDAGTCSECGQTKQKVAIVTSPKVIDGTHAITVVPGPRSVKLNKVFEVELKEVPEVGEVEAIVVDELETTTEIMVVRPTIGVGSGSGSCDGCCCCCCCKSKGHSKSKVHFEAKPSRGSFVWSTKAPKPNGGQKVEVYIDGNRAWFGGGGKGRGELHRVHESPGEHGIHVFRSGDGDAPNIFKLKRLSEKSKAETKTKAKKARKARKPRKARKARKAPRPKRVREFSIGSAGVGGGGSFAIGGMMPPKAPKAPRPPKAPKAPSVFRVGSPNPFPHAAPEKATQSPRNLERMRKQLRQMQKQLKKLQDQIRRLKSSRREAV